MQLVRLFSDSWSVLHDLPRAERGPGCRSCGLVEAAQAVGLPADGRPGGLLVLGLSARGTARRPFAGRDEVLLRQAIGRHWPGPVAYDSALRCAVDRGTRVVLSQYQDETSACRPYTAEVVADVGPERVLAFGPQAAASLLGVTYPDPGGRRVYGWVPVGDRVVPCFMLRHAETYRENPHHERWTLEDLQWALTVPVDELPPPQYAARYGRCESVADVASAVEELRAHGRIAQDVETYGRMHDRDFRVFALGLATVERHPRAWMVPEHLLRDPEVLSALRLLYRDRDVEVAGHNNKYDASAVAIMLGIPDLPVSLGGTDLQRKLQEVDVLGRLSVASLRVGMSGHKDEAARAKARARKALLSLRGKMAKDPEGARRKIELAASVRDEHHYDDWSAEECAREGLPLDPAGSRAGRRRLVEDWLHAADPRACHDADAYAYALAARGTIETYCVRDTVAAALLDLRESEEVERHPVHSRTYAQVVRPCIRAVSQMERWGVPVDRTALESFSTLLHVEMGACMEECRRHGLTEPSKDAAVADLLFRQLRMPVEFRTEKKNTPSVADEALARLVGRHPVVAAIRQHRSIQKMSGNYAGGLLKHVRADGRVHPSFRIAGAESGRMSCSDPNLQTIPSRGKWARLAKSVFAPRPGRVLVQLDYNQMELRIAAHLSGDAEMLAIFRAGKDYHAETARLVAPLVWKTEYWKLTKEEAAADPVLAQRMDDMRRAAKCFHPDTEVLTRSGWRRIVDLTPGQEVMTATPGAGFGVRLAWDTPLEVFRAKHPSGCLVHLHNEGIDVRVTPDHGMLAFNVRGEPRKVLPLDMPHQHRWANAGNLNSGSVAESETLLRLAVATQADGSYQGGSIRFGFSKVRKIERLRGLLTAAALPYTERTRGRVTTFRLRGQAAAGIRRLLDDDKTLPWWWLDLQPGLAEAVLEEATYWDSHKANNWRMYIYFSSTSKNVDVLQALAALHSRKTRAVGGRLSVKDHHTTRGGNLRVEVLEYDGDVACLTVPSGAVLVRDRGVVLVCHQTVNFGLIYGKGDQSMAEEAQIPVETAAQVREAILGKFADLARHIQDHVNFTRRNGFTRTFHADGAIARMRPLPDISSRAQEYKGHAERAAWNTPVQGSAADYLNRALSRSVGYVVRSGVDAFVDLQVHDSMLLEASEEDADEVTAEVRGHMLDFPTLCPLVVDEKRGRSWGDLE